MSIDGVDYTIDVTQPARYDDSGALVAPDGRRIRDLMFDGAPIDPNQLFLVVTNNYRASGGGGFPGCDGTNVVIEAPDANRDVVLKYIASQTQIAPKANGAWRFAPWPSDSGCDLPDVACCVRTFSPARPEADLDGASARRFREVARRDGVIGARISNHTPALFTPNSASRSASLVTVESSSSLARLYAHETFKPCRIVWARLFR